VTQPKPTLATKLKHEIAELLPPTIYFFVALHFVAFLQALMNRHDGMSLPTSLQITLAALVMGKSVLLADMLPFINRYPDAPLIWNVSWKSTVYFIVAFGIHYLERLVEFWRKSTDFVAANRALFAEIDWGHFWAIQLLLAVLILAYCVGSELARVLGRAELKVLFFGPLPPGRTAREAVKSFTPER
jgi:hypothetical protein